METVDTVVWTLWAMLPAYIPNNAAVLAGGGRPIDGGRTWGERRVLGDGKTWRGTLIGTAAGTALALGLTQVTPSVSATLGTDLPTFSLRAGLGLAFGAMLGDIGASFLKRRTGRERTEQRPDDEIQLVQTGERRPALATSSAFEEGCADVPEHRAEGESEPCADRKRREVDS